MYIFILSCLLVYCGYDVVDKNLVIFSYYDDSDRKLYIQKNIVKALYLLVLSFVYNLFYVYEWDNAVLRMLASFIERDIAGLYRCENCLSAPGCIMLHRHAFNIYIYYRLHSVTSRSVVSLLPISLLWHGPSTSI